MFKFIHAADIHLDSPLRGLEQYEGAPVEEIRNAARRALENLVDLAIDHEVSFVLIAGDVYDGDWRDIQTGFFFVRQASRLREHGIPLYLISGNHDAANRMTRTLRLPDNVTFFPSEAPDSAVLPEIGVAIHGQSFASAAVYDDLSEFYPPAHSGLFNIGILHTCATGREGHERYAPCSVERLALKGYDYWALGHVHTREILSEEPFIAFPGNIQGRDVGETGPKGCLLVSVEDDRSVSAEFQALDVCRWEIASIDVANARSHDEVLDLVAEGIQGCHANAAGRSVALRVILEGASSLHNELFAKKHYLVEQIRAVAIDVGKGDVWIEKVKVSVQSSAGERGGPTADIPDGAMEQLRTVFDNARSDRAFLEAIGFDCNDIARKLPAELKHLVGIGDTAWLREVIDEAECVVLSRLSGKGSEE